MEPTPDSKIVSENIIKQLKKTRPWVFIISILGFLFVASSLFSTVGMLLTELNFIDPSFGLGNQSAKFSLLSDPSYQTYIAILLGFIGVILYFIVFFTLFKYARGITKVVESKSLLDFEYAIAMQASFWKSLGIVIIFNLLLVIFSFVLAFIFMS